jgi:hypothetical protein
LLTVTNLLLIALVYVTDFCCDCHEDGFKLQDYLPGFLYTGADAFISTGPKPANRYRPTWERQALDELLISWVQSHLDKPNAVFRSSYDILSYSQREMLIKARYENITSPSVITQILNESPEWEALWAQGLYELIQNFQAVRPSKPVKA